MVSCHRPTVHFVPSEVWPLVLFCKHVLSSATLSIKVLQLLHYLLFLVGAFAYNNHPLYRVDILGWLVRVEERASMFQYGGQYVTNLLTN